MRATSLSVLGSSILLACSAFATDGVLDTTYNTPTGFISTSFGASDLGYGGVMQPDGKMIVVGGGRPVSTEDFAVVRYNANGTLDTGFGTSGKFSLEITSGQTDRPTCVGLQSDGKIIVAGYTRIVSGNDDFCIIRLTTAGVLDTTFGTSGITKVDFGNSFSERCQGLAIQSDDKIVLTGFMILNVAGDQNNGVVRLTANGALDATFGSGGKFNYDIGGATDTPLNTAVQSDGKIVVLGQSPIGSDFRITLARLTAAGALDTSFNTTGIVTFQFPSSTSAIAQGLALQSDGKIVIAGANNASGDGLASVIRFNTNGSLDTTFNTTGYTQVNFASSSDTFRTVAVQSDGKIVAAGEYVNGATNDSMLARFTSTGALDTTFGSGATGKVTQSFGANSDRITSIGFQSGGAIVAGGNTSATSGADDFMAARFTNVVAVAASPPTVASISPTSGSTTGGTVVTITGTNFTGATGVTIGGTAVTSFHVISATSIEAVTPAGTAGAKSLVVTTAGGSNTANSLFTYNAAVASTVVDFETAATGTPVAKTFTSGAKTWSFNGLLADGSSAGLGSSPVGFAAAASDHYLDTGFLVARSTGSVGSIVAPTGTTFRAVGIDIWPSKNQGNDIIPYPGSGNNGSNLPGETGHTFTVKGYKNGVVVVNVNVIDTLRTPPQSGTVGGGYWHHLEFTNSAFDTTDIDQLEIYLNTQSGTAFDGPNSGSALTTPNYIALDNFVYSTLTATTPAVTVPGGTTTLTTTTSGTAGTSVNFSITGANLTGFPGNLTVTAPANVEVSANNSTWGSTASIPYSTATLASTPVYVRLAGTGTLGTISGNVSISGGGLGAAVTQAVSGTLNAAAPTVASVSSTKANGSYNATVLIPITVTFSAPVTVTGTPTLALNSGGSGSYSSGSGTATLTFNYTVGATDNATLLDCSSTSALALAGGTISATTGGTAANLTLPTPGGANSLGVNKAIVIDTTAPTITSITRLTPSGQTTASNVVTFRVTYSEAVTVPGVGNFSVVAVNGSNIVGTVTGVTGTGTTRDVTVSITSGTGEFRLRGVN